VGKETGMSQESLIASLLNGIEFDDPRLYDLLNALSKDFYTLLNTLQPPSTVTAFGITGQILGPPAVDNFTATTYNNNLKLAWTSSGMLSTYEIRYKVGSYAISDWDTATTILTTSTLSADINPLTIPLLVGTYTFFIKSVDANGVYSTLASIVILDVPAILAPTITCTVVGNSVLLYWTAPTSVWLLDHYNVYKDAVLQGRVSGTFEAIFETTGGTFSYTVEPVDIVGNVGSLSAAVVAVVQNPADFVLQSTLTSTFSGTKTNCQLESIGGVDYLLACIDTAKTFENHFIDNVWTDPQAQVTAGYDLYIEPAETTGSYVEIFDFGSIISNIIVVLNWNTISIVGSVSTGTCTIETSTDAIVWSAATTGTSAFAASVRYVRFTMNFVGADDKSLAYFYNLQCLLNVHYEQDGGIITAISTDAAGTVVTLNKAFKSVISITLTPNSTSPRFAAYDFAFPLNPTTFKVKAYDDAGARVTVDVTWLVRGIF
jgi:hypothetical protein